MQAREPAPEATAAEKALAKNWMKAIDADNLVFEFHDPNAFREVVQRRHKMREKPRGSGSAAP